VLTPLPGACVAAAGAAFLATGLVALAARRAGFTAPFNPIGPQQRAPAALGGGAGLWLGLVAGALVLDLSGNGGPLRFCAALLPALLVGLLDDTRPFGPLGKLLLQILAAALAMAIMQRGAPTTFLIGIAVGVTLMNAINFLDVSDGFAASISAVSFVGLFWVVGDTGALLLGAACLGFLPWNRPAARIYMGDAGGHLLGMAGALAATGTAGGLATMPPVAVCFAVALAELAMLVAVRTRKGIPFWRGSPDHIALRLQRAGLSKMAAALLAAAAQGLAIVAFMAFAR
jgi:UDP-N-acetylmuramyl pentapeptide phosphotransferase/UDP-N-acetylglucosamine-1-phosphate transferase